MSEIEPHTEMLYFRTGPSSRLWMVWISVDRRFTAFMFVGSGTHGYHKPEGAYKQDVLLTPTSFMRVLSANQDQQPIFILPTNEDTENLELLLGSDTPGY